MTALHSINALLASKEENEVYYIPTLDEFPVDMASFTSKSKDVNNKEHSFAAVYDGYFDPEVMSQSVTLGDNTYYKVSPKVYKNNKSSRALSVLGYDYLLSNEIVKITNNDNTLYADYSSTLVAPNSVGLLTAIMNTYKALGQYQYDIRLAFTKDDSLKVSTSPIQQYLSVLLDKNDSIDTTNGKTWVWMSRTNSSLYMEKAYTDHLISLDEDILKGVSQVTDFSSSDLNISITLAEFCSLTKTMMTLYGEPVLTKDEEKILLQVYGKNIPYYLNPEELDAVKYLIAKGILNPSREEGYNYLSNLNLNDMLDILMAIKDPNSRNTFKDIELTIDPHLLDMGYYETSIAGDINPLNNLSYDYSAATMYDYFIKADDDLSNFYVAGHVVFEDLGLLGKSYISGIKKKNADIVSYLGVTAKGYYWFKIATQPSLLRKYGLLDANNNIKIAYDTKHYYKVPYGGGVYNVENNTFKQSTLDKEGYSAEYVDTARKGESQDLLSAVGSLRTYLSKTKDVIITFSLASSTWKEDLSKITFDDAKLTPLVTAKSWSFNNYKITRMPNDNNSALTFFRVEGCTDLADFKGRIKHPNINGRYTEYQSYCQDGENVLVNFDYLQDVGIAKSYIELEDEIVMLTTDYNNIYLCPKQGVIIVGNTIYPAMPNSLMYFKQDGKMFVDYRAVMGWSGDYYVFQNINGSITITVSDRSTSSQVITRPVYMPMGTYNTNATGLQGSNSSSLKVQYYKATAGQNEGILMTSLFPLANYFVYMGSEEAGRIGTNQDYLFVFKLKDTKVHGDPVDYTNDSKARTILNDNLGYTAPDNWLVYAYPIYEQSGRKQHNPAGIHFDPAVGYYFTPSTVTANMYKRYYSSCTTKKDGTGDLLFKGGYGDEIVLPFIANPSNKSYVYNINFNIFKYKDSAFTYGTCPVPFLFSGTNTKLNYTSSWVPNYTGAKIKTKEYENLMSNISISTAPTGVISSLMNLGALDSKSVKNTASVVYMGTIKVDIQASDWSQYGDHTYYVKAAGKKFYQLSDTDERSYKILRSTYGGYILGIMSDDDILIPGDDALIDQTASPNITNGSPLIGFDWEQYKFKNLVEGADDFITIATIAILNIIPRIAIYIFMVLIALSLVVNIKPWVMFCDNIFDVYKFFTFNRKDIHTIDTYRMFWSSILAMAVFGLFMDGTVINVFAWLIRGISGILTR